MARRNLPFHRLFVLLFLNFAPFFYGQNLNDVIANLKNELAKNPDEKRRAAIYSDLTWYYASVSVDSALSYGRRAVQATLPLKDSTMLAQIYSDLGAVHFRNNDFKNAEKNYLKSYSIRQQQRNSAGIAKLNNNLASVYQSTFQYKKAMAMYLEGLKYFEQTGDVKNVNFTKANIGLLYADLKDYHQSVKYIRDVIDYFERQERTVEVQTKLCENYLNLGKAYHLQKDYANAERFYTKSAEICEKVGNKQGYAFSKRNLGNLSLLQRKDSVAREALEESTETRKQFNSALDSESNGIAIAEQLITEGKYAEAKNTLHKILPAFLRTDSKENLLSTYKLLTNVYHHLDQTDSADFYFEKYIALDNDLVNRDVNRDTAEMEKKYQSLKKDNEILEQKSKILKRNIIVVSLLALLLLAFAYYRNYQHRQKVQLQKEILHQQDLATNAVMRAEDNERKRMATHLHDGIGQLLTAANMNVSVLSDYRREEASFNNILSRVKDILNEAITDVRTLSHQIMPNMLIKNSLADALRDLISKSTTPTLQIDLRIVGLADNIDQNVQVVMYRIIQECINNTIRHAEASRVEIAVIQQGGLLEADFKDNGKGFNTQKISKQNDGLGLDNMKSRIDMLKGQMTIQSAEGEGTHINMKIPL